MNLIYLPFKQVKAHKLNVRCEHEDKLCVKCVCLFRLATMNNSDLTLTLVVTLALAMGINVRQCNASDEKPEAREIYAPIRP